MQTDFSQTVMVLFISRNIHAFMKEDISTKVGSFQMAFDQVIEIQGCILLHFSVFSIFGAAQSGQIRKLFKFMVDLKGLPGGPEILNFTQPKRTSPKFCWPCCVIQQIDHEASFHHVLA